MLSATYPLFRIISLRTIWIDHFTRPATRLAVNWHDSCPPENATPLA